MTLNTTASDFSQPHRRLIAGCTHVNFHSIAHTSNNPHDNPKDTLAFLPHNVFRPEIHGFPNPILDVTEVQPWQLLFKSSRKATHAPIPSTPASSFILSLPFVPFLLDKVFSQFRLSANHQSVQQRCTEAYITYIPIHNHLSSSHECSSTP